jgi:hypothetical protein
LGSPEASPGLTTLFILPCQFLSSLDQSLQLVGDHVADDQVDILHLNHLVTGNNNAEVGEAAGLAALESAEADGGSASFPGFFEGLENILGIAAPRNSQDDISRFCPVGDLLAENLVETHIVPDAGDE